MLFRARQFEFRFPRPTLVMGIVNVTPDSFSDGGKFLNTEAAVAHALQLVEEGAEILDIGGESTRPGAQPVSEAEELRRVIPVIERLAAEINSRWGETPSSPKIISSALESQGSTESCPTRKILLSIDTMKPAVARAALAAGASIVNDVAANRSDDVMWEIVAEFGAGYVCMHAGGRSTGVSPVSLHQSDRPTGSRPYVAVAEFFRERLGKLSAAGVAADQVVFDPGIGFGKTLAENLSLLASLEVFQKLQRPVLLGVSRKSFIGKIIAAEPNERLPASLACATLAVAHGVQLIRTHEVAATVQAVRVAEAILAQKPNVE